MARGTLPRVMICGDIVNVASPTVGCFGMIIGAIFPPCDYVAVGALTGVMDQGCSPFMAVLTIRGDFCGMVPGILLPVIYSMAKITCCMVVTCWSYIHMAANATRIYALELSRYVTIQAFNIRVTARGWEEGSH